MTQALLNNLNIQTEGNFGLNDKGAKDNLADFAKILQGKTDKAEVNNTQTNKTTSKETEDTEVKSTIGDLKNDIKNDIEIQNDTENDSFIEEAIVNVVDLALVQETIEESEETSVSEIEEDTEETAEDIPTTTPDNTITEEDSTMNNNEMVLSQPLENPATAMMLQSQLQKHSFKDNQNSDSDETEDNNTNLKTTKEVGKSLKNFENVQKTEKETNLISLADKNNSIEKSDNKRLKEIVNEEIIKDLHIEALKTEVATTENASSDLMNNQTPQEQAVKLMINGVNNTGDKIEFVSTVQTNKAPTEVNPSKIIEQISKQIEGMYNGSKVNIVLNPEALGKVSLQILNLKEGLSAQFTVATQEAQNIISKGLSGLKESLLAHGINVDSVTVKLQESGDSEHKFDWTEQEGSRGGNKHQGSRKQKDDEKNFEQMMFEFNENGNV